MKVVSMWVFCCCLFVASRVFCVFGGGGILEGSFFFFKAVEGSLLHFRIFGYFFFLRHRSLVLACVIDRMFYLNVCVLGLSLIHI